MSTNTKPAPQEYAHTSDMIDVLDDLPCFLAKVADLFEWLGDLAASYPHEAQTPGFAAALSLSGIALNGVADKEGIALAKLGVHLRKNQPDNKGTVK